MKQYKLLPAAESDLENIWHYTARTWGVEQAVTYIDGLDQTFQLLAESPLICRERWEFSPPVRIHHHEKHLVIYLVKDTDIHIVRILHETMDIGAQIDEEE